LQLLKEANEAKLLAENEFEMFKADFGFDETEDQLLARTLKDIKQKKGIRYRDPNPTAIFKGSLRPDLPTLVSKRKSKAKLSTPWLNKSQDGLRETNLKVHPIMLKQDVSMMEKMLKPDYINDFPISNLNARYV
jgi:hypothetical protein